jgi:hypothetical protein
MVLTDKSEIIWEEAVVAYLRQNPFICLDVMSKTTRNLVQDCQCTARDPTQHLPNTRLVSWLFGCLITYLLSTVNETASNFSENRFLPYNILHLLTVMFVIYKFALN